MVTQIIALAAQKSTYVLSIIFSLGLRIAAYKTIDMLIIPVTIQLTYLGCHYKDLKKYPFILKLGPQRISTTSLN
ncbi:hypothetical protein CRE_23359 [Caenorhabditis remanei]|uniref:Uncharacterized protein n=1 Tax=Caenorhabditis remanei TaxID=31234 RepID=E3MH26_CAERE|nr:hypothetical protein CRE_23359 [Caenorhabditis remanei]